MTAWQGILTIAAVALGTLCTRFLPFLVFPESKQPPKLVEYFGKMLPYAMTGLLVVYALRNTPILTGFARHSGTHRLCRHHIAASVEAQHAAFDRRRHRGVYAADTAGVLGACLAANPVKDG